jgi:hypothetical protein
VCPAVREELTEVKACGTCGEVKPLEQFYRSQRSKDGRQYHCKACGNRKRREWAAANPERNAEWKRDYHSRLTPQQKADKRLSRFRMTVADYDRLLEAQGGGCASCGAPPPPDQRLHVDHDHACCDTRYTCGQCVRGLLCLNCNAALGHVQDSKERLMNLIHYLSGTPDQCPPQFNKR